ncbi:MAG: carbamoyl-phosphate synthase large subunit [Oligoflexia bacterium]|nr:carbamoyl-phosphate synthase large subunit [Oligoflexia bacterium]
MPKRTDIKKIMLLGSGPIVIGQACEFDYSGTQACKALREEGYEVILVNSNPATIMTDPESANRVYIEPLELPYLRSIIEKERPQALIPTLGGQTALNAAMKLHAEGVLKQFNVELLGASVEAINKAEDRELFKKEMAKIGAQVPLSFTVHSMKEGWEAVKKIGYPVILRPSFTLGGSGGGIAKTPEEFEKILEFGLSESPTTEVLLEQSVLGWKEFELEVMRDHKGTFVVICSIENLDPMGVHTGDSITVAPIMTLTDQEYQAMRDEACRVIETIGVATGGANIQFAVNPANGERIVIEMNPRVSRSSALASKATGFPIAKIAAKLAVGYELEEILNDITKTTPSCFEPSIDYVVTKIPRFDFEKFPGSKDFLTTQMKSVGEVMGIGRTFKESLLKAVASLEKGTGGFDPVPWDEEKLVTPNSRRLFYVAQAFREGLTVDQIFEKTAITPWFLEKIQELVLAEKSISLGDLESADSLLNLKRLGMTDAFIAAQLKVAESTVTQARKKHSINPGYWSVDTCAGEFESNTPYYYSSYWAPAKKPLGLESAVVVLGSGPNRIGQAIEFDYACVQAIRSIRSLGRTSVMINSNPETVSTDYDTSDLLFFEPLTAEHVIEVLRFVEPKGVCVQFGGQTPIHLAPKISKAGFQILGSSLESISQAEDRKLFSQICRSLGLALPKHETASTAQEAIKAAERVGFPVICRPSFVLGGRKMEIIEEPKALQNYLSTVGDLMAADSPLLIDEFLDHALELDVDVVSDGQTVLIGGVVEHIEAAGTHSGDSMGVLPPQRVGQPLIDRIEDLSRKLCHMMKVVGHLNLQLAVKNDVIYVLEANPRSSRSVPFVSKATGIPLVRLATQAMLGEPIHITRYWKEMDSICVKGVVFPFKKFQEADALLGPEMRSTGETMGRSHGVGGLTPDYAEALEKAFLSAGVRLPSEGTVFLSIRDRDKEEIPELAKILSNLGFDIIATPGTAKFLEGIGVKVRAVNKVQQGSPHCVDAIKSGMVSLVINTVSGAKAVADSFSIRRSCVDKNIPCITEMSVVEHVVRVLQSRHNHPRYQIRTSPL